MKYIDLKCLQQFQHNNLTLQIRQILKMMPINEQNLKFYSKISDFMPDLTGT